MADKVRLSGFLPGEEKNGLKAHEEAWLGSEAPDPVVALVQIERKKRTVDDDTDEVTSAIRITAVEPLEGADAKAARAQLADLRSRRTGVTQLDIDAAEEVR